MEDADARDASEGVANLQLDEATGEKVSKSELKRRQKLRAQEEKKQQRAAAAPTKVEKKRSAEEYESNLTPSVSTHNLRNIMVLLTEGLVC